MKTFMYFNEIAPDKIAYFFPEEDASPELEHKSEVMIIDGKWKGGTGKVVGPCKDDVLKTVVAVELPNLGITVSAPCPIYSSRGSAVRNRPALPAGQNDIPGSTFPKRFKNP